MLESLEFVWDSRELEWQNMFSELREFKKKHGHTSPPDKKDKLGSWCARQRSTHRKGKLSSERFHLLESIGFIWNF